ncbi:MAG TPA: 6-bladed beta-propeller [Longimicrobium sp.]
MRHRRGPACLWALALAALPWLTACGASADAPSGAVHHPTRANLPLPAQVGNTFLPAAQEPGSDAARIVQRLAGAAPEFSVGKEKGTAAEMLGEVKGAAFDSLGNLFVLDGTYNRVMVYSKDGRLSEQFGRPGRGPDEFLNPNDLAISRGRVFVADRAGVMKVFRRGAGGYELDRTLPSLSAVQDVCVSGDHMYAAGWTPGSPHVVHQLTLDGRRVRSFGQAYRDSSELVQMMMNKLVIGCNASTGTVLVMNTHVPYVYGYSPEGRLLWTSRVPDWKSMELTSFHRDGQEDAFKRKSTGETDAGWNFIDLGNEHVLFQVLRRNRTPEGTTFKLRSYVVSARTGAGAFAGDALPLTLAGTANRFAVSENAPFPRVVVHAAKN